MEGQRPASARLLERRRGHVLGIEAFGDGVTHTSRRGSIGGEPRERGRDRRRRRAHGSILLSHPRTYPTHAGCNPHRRQHGSHAPIPRLAHSETSPRPPVITRSSTALRLVLHRPVPSSATSRRGG